jgi:hypothetical protein
VGGVLTHALRWGLFVEGLLVAGDFKLSERRGLSRGYSDISRQGAGSYFIVQAGVIRTRYVLFKLFIYNTLN